MLWHRIQLTSNLRPHHGTDLINYISTSPELEKGQERKVLDVQLLFNPLIEDSM